MSAQDLLPESTPRVFWSVLLLTTGWLLWVDQRSVPVEDVAYPASRHRDAGGLDPFTARRAELQFLPDVGPGLSRVIHEAVRTGRLHDLDALETLRGIGPARAKTIRDAISGDAHE